MQNRYSGDIGDYSKFVLLKKLFNNEKIGLIWYLYPDETHNNDGLHKDYHKYNDKLSDKELITILENVANSKERNVQNLQNRLKDYFNNQNIVYFNEFIENNYHFKMREKFRNNWIQKAVNHLKDCSVIFADPDNGIEVKSVKKTNKKGGKYIFFDEIEMFFKTSDIVVIYQHFPRVKQDFFIKDMLNKIKSKIKGEYCLYAIKFKPVSPRVYFVLVKNYKKDEFENKLNEFLNSEYSKGFEVIKEYNIDNELTFYAKKEAISKEIFKFFYELRENDYFGFATYQDLNRKMLVFNSIVNKKDELNLDKNKFYFLFLSNLIDENELIEINEKTLNSAEDFLIGFHGVNKNIYIYEILRNRIE